MSDFATCSVFIVLILLHILCIRLYTFYRVRPYLLRCWKMKCYSFISIHFFHFIYSGERPHSCMTFKRIYALIFYDYYYTGFYSSLLFRVSKRMISSFRCVQYIFHVPCIDPIAYALNEAQRFRLPFKRS